MINNGAPPQTPLKGQMSLENPALSAQKPPPDGGGFHKIKVLVELFQKLAGSRGSALSRRPQAEKHSPHQRYRSAMIYNGAPPHASLKGRCPLRIPF